MPHCPFAVKTLTQRLEVLALSARLAHAGADIAQVLRVRASSCRCVQALFFEVTAEKADQRCSTLRLPQCGQVVISASCSAMVRIFSNVFLQALQKNS